MRLGVASLRASLLALRAARAAAALDGRGEVQRRRRARWPRGWCWRRAPPCLPPADAERRRAPRTAADAAADRRREPAAEDDAADASDGRRQALEDRLVAAAQAALPAGLLAALLGGEARARRRAASARCRRSPRSGRPVGLARRRAARRRAPEPDRHAARRRALAAAARAPRPPPGRAAHPRARASDLRVARLQQRAATATLFVIDASGSSALHRLAEAKGAVELLLADCYVRRDQVGVIAFRGRGAEVLLPPTRSLVRAKRSLAALPGGGGTPLAAGLRGRAGAWPTQVRRSGATPVVVLLTDGRANIARDGAPGPRARRGRCAAGGAAVARARG